MRRLVNLYLKSKENRLDLNLYHPLILILYFNDVKMPINKIVNMKKRKMNLILVLALILKREITFMMGRLLKVGRVEIGRRIWLIGRRMLLLC